MLAGLSEGAVALAGGKRPDAERCDGHVDGYFWVRARTTHTHNCPRCPLPAVEAVGELRHAPTNKMQMAWSALDASASWRKVAAAAAQFPCDRIDRLNPQLQI